MIFLALFFLWPIACSGIYFKLAWSLCYCRFLWLHARGASAHQAVAQFNAAGLKSTVLFLQTDAPETTTNGLYVEPGTLVPEFRTP
jgi:hypothetical protein